MYICVLHLGSDQLENLEFNVKCAKKLEFWITENIIPHNVFEHKKFVTNKAILSISN